MRATGKLFFVDIELKASGELFHRLGVSTLPYVFRLPSTMAFEADGRIKIKPDDVMKHADYSKFPWEADDFAAFIQDRVGPCTFSTSRQTQLAGCRPAHTICLDHLLTAGIDRGPGARLPQKRFPATSIAAGQPLLCGPAQPAQPPAPASNTELPMQTGVSIGDISKPSFTNSPLFPVLALAVLAAGAYVAYHLYYAEFMKNQLIWTAGTLLVFWFAVSGGMHNIIRGVPMYFFDPKSGKVNMFLNQAQGQLGAEGFIMGSLCMSFALSVATLSYVAPRMASPQYQRGVCWAALVVGGLSLRSLVNAYTWKTGYRLRTWF